MASVRQISGKRVFAAAILCAQVHWHAPKFVQLVDKQHGRFIIAGKTKPGVKIKLEPDATSIDSRNRAHELTTEEMAPSSKAITVGPSGRFKIFLTLPFQHDQIPFVATMTGRHEKHYILSMLFKNQQFKKSSRWKFGLETRSVAYSQTNINNLNETMLAATISYYRTFAKRWSFQTQSFIDVAQEGTFSTNPADMSARFWGLNSDMIYAIPLDRKKWSVGIAGGFFYMTMLPSGMSFGFNNLWGPELYPIFRYALDNKNTFDFYFKYAPIYSQISVNFNNYETSAGAEWTKLNSDNRSISLKLELLQNAFNNGSASGKATAVNLGVSYGVP